MFQKLSAVLFAALFAMGLVCLVIGLAQNNGNRLVPGGLLMIFATLSGAGAYDLLTSGRMIVRRTLWSNECEWRDRREVPIRHWSGLIILSLASLGSAAFAGAFFLGLMPPHPNPPPWSDRAELATVAIVLTLLGLSLFCFVRTLRYLKPDTSWPVGKLLLFRDLQPNGYLWLVGYYLSGLACVILMFISPLIAEWVHNAR